MPALLLANSLTGQLVDTLSDNTFAGIHHLQFFDWALLIPYFWCSAILSVYGMHRYEMVRGYFKHRKHLPLRAARAIRTTPRVTIQLPLYNERYVVERLIEQIAKIDYPRELLQIQVLDDSTDDTHPFTAELVRDIAPHGRADRVSSPDQSRRVQGRRAAGRHADRHRRIDRDLRRRFRSARGFPACAPCTTSPIPRSAWCKPAGRYLNRHYNLLTEVQAMLLDGHFVLEHGARCGGGLFFNFNGTAGILRASMIEDAGGWQHDTLTEDSDLSYRAQLKGWRFVYVPDVECPSELPVETYGFQVQQSRWAKGLTQVAKKLLPAILRSDIPWRKKLEAIFHLTPNISYPLMMIVSALMLPVMIVRFYMGWFQMVTIDLPLIVASFWSISAFYLMAQHEIFPEKLEARRAAAAGADGGGRGADAHQYEGGAGGAVRDREQFRAHAQVCHWRSEGEAREHPIPAPQRLAALRGTGLRLLLPVHGCVCH